MSTTTIPKMTATERATRLADWYKTNMRNVYDTAHHIARNMMGNFAINQDDGEAMHRVAGEVAHKMAHGLRLYQLISSYQTRECTHLKSHRLNLKSMLDNEPDDIDMNATIE